MHVIVLEQSRAYLVLIQLSCNNPTKLLKFIRAKLHQQGTLVNGLRGCLLKTFIYSHLGERSTEISLMLKNGARDCSRTITCILSAYTVGLRK